MSLDSEEDLDIITIDMRLQVVMPLVDDALNQEEHGGQLPDTVGTQITSDTKFDVRFEQ